MPSISFSEFAKLLYPYRGGNDTMGAFVITLTDKLIKGQYARAIGAGHKNPMRDKDERTLLNYYSGERLIPRKDASAILRHIDKYPFENFIRPPAISEDAEALLEADLTELLQGDTLDGDLDTAEKCAEIFVQILKELASPDSDKESR